MPNTIILNDNTIINIVDLSTDLLEECVITFTNDSINITKIDTSMICFIYTKSADVYEKCNL